MRPNESGSVPLRSRDGSSLTKQRKTAKKIWILAFYGELLVLNLAIADLGSFWIEMIRRFIACLHWSSFVQIHN